MRSLNRALYTTMAVSFIFVLSSLLFCRPTIGVQFVCPQNSIRVALAVNLSFGEFSISQGEYELVDYVTQKVLSSGDTSGTWIVVPKGSQNIQISNNGSQVEGLLSSQLILRQKNITQQNLFLFKNKPYRGDLLIENINGTIHMINVLDIEQYLYGVVGLEIGIGAPSEAYKAQAVVSRTYALYYKQHPQLNYDLGISQNWQVYGGYDAERQGGEELRKAVDATKGLAIYYDNNLIQAFFHSNSGGYTESGENVWYASLPYLRPVATPQDSHALLHTQSGEWPAITYQWEKSFTKQELSNRIQQWNTDNSQERINVGTIMDVTTSCQAINPVTRDYLPQQTLSGRVTQLDFIGTNGIKSFFRDHIRSVLGLRSTLFRVCYDSMVQIWDAYNTVDTYNQTNDIMGITVDGLVSKLNGKNDKYYVICADGVKTLPKTFSTVTFIGRGYGHGLGMSQWGARGMAANGIDYRAIIEHFYNQDYYDGRLVVKSCI